LSRCKECTKEDPILSYEKRSVEGEEIYIVVEYSVRKRSARCA
jgi:hypothetical protein